ncbi:MAG: hypothetical protein ACOC15_02620, partial [Desulfovibrionales bacterium]
MQKPKKPALFFPFNFRIGTWGYNFCFFDLLLMEYAENGDIIFSRISAIGVSPLCLSGLAAVPPDPEEAFV